MKNKSYKLFKRGGSTLLIVVLLFSFLSFSPFSGDEKSAYGMTKGTFRYGAVIKDAEGKPYSWRKSMMAPAYWWDAEGNRIAGEALTYESATAGIQQYTIDTGKENKIGYCVAHGVRVDTTSSLRAEEALENWVHTAGYPESSRRGIEFALIYGYQQGRHISDLAAMGFSDSRYWHKTASSYTLGDWYIATQVLIWEYQQLVRTDSVEGGHGRQANGLVEANHYYDIVRGRAASDIYNYMAACIKKHGRAASFAKTDSKEAEASAGWKMEKDQTTGYYTCTLQDGNQIGMDLEATGTSAANWEIKRSGNQYTFLYKGKNLSEEGIVFRFGKKISLLELAGQEDLLIWSWSSGGGLRQAVATGVPQQTAQMYIKFRSAGPDVSVKTPEAEYWPVFQFPVHKDDLNPGWDGDPCTPMGDGELSSTFVLYRNGLEVDRVTLDEYGNTQVLTDQPWTAQGDLLLKESGTYTHVIPGEPPSVHCSVTPIKLEWTNREEIEYEIIEIPADGRLSEADSGTGSGKRRYKVSYYAVTEDGRTCVQQEPQWSEIRYQVTYQTVEGRVPLENPQAAAKKAEGTLAELDSQLVLEEEIWINDNYRGSLLLKKQKEAEDIFQEEGSSGSLSLSVKSRWKMYLLSGGFEEHPYIRFQEEGYTETGAKKYRVMRDTSGEDNSVTDMVISDTGSLFITDIPYGTYIVEEVAADDDSFVLEQFEIFIEKDGAQYTKSITNKKKENVIKVIKTDAETGKAVDLKGAKFYIRYMGNPLLEDPSQAENYGRLLPNGTNIHSGEKDYTFSCNAQGEIVLPYDLEFGTYRLEEFLLPEGYFVGGYDSDGQPYSMDFGVVGEYGKDDDGRTDPSLSWEAMADEDPANDWIAIYDEEGRRVSYKAGDVFNYYTFQVEKQDVHMDGEAYVKYYKAVAMKNNPVKGRIEIEKEGEILEGFQAKEKNGYTVWTPSFTFDKLKGAVFGIFAASDLWRKDGSDSMKAYDSQTEQLLSIPLKEKTHSGVNGEGQIYEEGILHHQSGANLYYHLEREASTENRFVQIYTSPEQRPASYSYQFEKEAEGLRYRYDLEVLIRNHAGGSQETKIFLTKTTSPAAGYMAEIPKTEATSIVGGNTYTPAVNVETGSGNVLDVFQNRKIYQADGKLEEDTDGTTVDLGEIGVKHYLAEEAILYRLTAEDVSIEERETIPGIDFNGDGDFDDPGDEKPVMQKKTVFEWKYGVDLLYKQQGTKAVIHLKDQIYKVMTEEGQWIPCDEKGNLLKTYQIPEGWKEVPYIPAVTEAEGESSLVNPHYVIITNEEEKQFRVLLEDQQTWQDCDEKGNFQKLAIDEYQVCYTKQSGTDEDFLFALDGIRIHSEKAADGTSAAVIESPQDWNIKPEIHLGIGYYSETEGNKTAVISSEPSAPLYFMTDTGIRTEMYLYGDYVRTLLTIPMEAVERNYSQVKPSIVFTQTGEVIEWLKELSPDDPVYKREAAYGNWLTAVRHEGDRERDVFYTVEILTNQTDGETEGPFEIVYQDGYTARIYKDKSEDGNDIGVMVITGEYKTSDGAVSDLIETITTDETGKGSSSFLPLGEYIVRELAAPAGYYLDDEKGQEVKLTYQDQYTPLVWESITSRNEAVSVEIDIEKVFETGVNTDQYVAGGGALFGLYNALPISYQDGELAEDTLLDTILIGEGGKELAETKLPEGLYYLQELSTRQGYQVNETPFYFFAGDQTMSSPLYISRDEEGKDVDGMTVKGVMDGYGKATIMIEVLNRYPAAQLQLNGLAYSLDQETEQEQIKIQVEKDMAKVQIPVIEGRDAQILLPNGKELDFHVEGNLYRYTYDGAAGIYVPHVANTAYYGGYQTSLTGDESEKTEEGDSFLLTAAAETSAVFVKTVSEQEASVKLEKGSLESITLDGKESGQSEQEEIKITLGQTLRLRTGDGALYTIAQKEEGQLSMEIGHSLSGEIGEKAGPSLFINGVDKTDELTFFKSVTLARQDSSAKKVQIKINTADDVNSQPIKNRGLEQPDVPEEPNIPEKPEKPNLPEEPEEAYIEIMKADKESGQPLPGAQFEIWSAKIDEKGDMKPDQLVYEGVTDESGRFMFESEALWDQNWFYREVKAPAGYKAEKQYQLIKSNGEKVRQIVVFNEKITGSLEILKLDKDTGAFLEGVAFEIWDSKTEGGSQTVQRGKIIFQGNTDRQGRLTVSGLVPGTYWYRESQPLDGYKEDGRYHKFYIGEDGACVQVTVENEKQELQIPKTGDRRRLFPYLWMMAGSLFIIVLWNRRRKRTRI